MVNFKKITRNKIIISISLTLLIFTSCRKINENIHIKKYSGTWSFNSYQIDSLNSAGEVYYTDLNSAVSGNLILNKDKSYLAENFSIPVIISFGNEWDLFYKSKKDVLLFKKTRATVIKKTKKELHFVLYYGDGTGKIAYKETLFFNKK